MTPQESTAEWKYRYEERIGILCEDRAPTREQMDIAAREADEVIERIKHESDLLRRTESR